jgi:hypothetical protein
MPKAQILTKYEHGHSQAYQAAVKDRELNWCAINLPYPSHSRRWPRRSAQLISLVVVAARIEKEKIPLINFTSR